MILKKVELAFEQFEFCDKQTTLFTVSVTPCAVVCVWSAHTQSTGVCCFKVGATSSTVMSELLKCFQDSNSKPLELQSRVAVISKLGASPYQNTADVTYAREIEETLAEHGVKVVGRPLVGLHSHCVQFYSVAGEVSVRVFDELERVETEPDEQPSSLTQSLFGSPKGARAYSDYMNPVLQSPAPVKPPTSSAIHSLYGAPRLIVVGSATGGIEALEVLVRALPKNSPPICIVQQIPKRLPVSLVNRLDSLCQLSVTEASDGQKVQANTVYIAEAGRHLKIMPLGASGLVFRLTDEDLVNGSRPSVDVLFKSVLRLGIRDTVAVLLSGTGRDGASGLLQLKQRGAHTIVQDEASSIVYGMAKAANEINAVCETLPLGEIVPAIYTVLEDPSLKKQLSGRGDDS